MAVAALFLFAHPSPAEKLMEGARQVPLTDDGRSRHLSWAWHADRIAYILEISDSQNQLRVRNVDGLEDQVVSPIGNPFFAEWSWGSDKLSYLFSNLRSSDSQGGVFIYDVPAKRTLSISPAYTMSAVAGFGGGGGSRGRGGRRRSGGGRRRGGSRGFFGFGSGPPLDGPYWSSDDQYVAYKVRPGSKEEVFVVDARTGKRTQILAQRNDISGQRWSPKEPPRLVIELEATAGRNDAAIVNAQPGKHFGSKAVREFIETHQPGHFFCGHIHEAAGNRAVLGRTAGRNLGKQGYLLEL